MDIVAFAVLAVFAGGVFVLYEYGPERQYPQPVASVAQNSFIEQKFSTNQGRDASYAARGDFTVAVSGDTATLFKGEARVQTITLKDDVVDSYKFIADNADDAVGFITTQDINFDGYPDIAKLSGVGYRGVNMIYDYYLFDAVAERFETDPFLTDISNPVFDTSARTTTSHLRSGPEYFTTVYTWNGVAYKKGKIISDATGKELEP